MRANEDGIFRETTKKDCECRKVSQVITSSECEMIE